MAKQFSADSTTLANPHRPLPIWLANTVGGALHRFGVAKPRFDPEQMIAEAKKKTGLSRFDDDSFIEPLRRLCESIESEAKLHPVGRYIIRDRLVGILTNKLRMQATLEAHPQIADIPIEAPIVIAGLQRTGTTMLHRLIAADPAIRSLATWEAGSPVPKPQRAGNGQDARIAEAKRTEKGLQYLSPAFFAIHPIDAHQPEEEIMLLDHSFLSTSFEATLHVPTFAAWLQKQDQLPAYRGLKRMLQYLRFQRGPDRWVLKTPHHLEWLDPLLEVFADAKLVQTHRDPCKTMGSFASMIAHARGIMSDEVDPVEVASHWANKVERMVTRATLTRDRVGEDRFIDVSYYDLIKDPFPQIERIYAFADQPLTQTALAAMKRARQANKQNKHGKHSYNLADFDLTKESIDARLKAYRDRFEIPYE